MSDNCFKWCSICSISCNSEDQWIAHEEGKPHLKNLKKTVKETENEEESTDCDSNNKTPDPFQNCQLCKLQMSGEKAFEDHIKGWSHQLLFLLDEKDPRILQDPVVKTGELDASRMYKMTNTMPRTYQIKLMEKAMTSDCVVYLPTGTGKTMVAILTMYRMLEANPTRPVLFLVDKVLLAIQQLGYIKKEFEGIKFRRQSTASLKSNSEGELEIEERELTIACVTGQGNLLEVNNRPIWQNDVFVTTAAYCRNLLENSVIRWENFSLAVFDEVHHCVGNHPYNELIQNYHVEITQHETRPKILGLTASPSGRSSSPEMNRNVQSLLKKLGDASIAFVEEDNRELRSYLSVPNLHQINVSLTDKETDFLADCIKYFLRCYMKLNPLSKTLHKNQNAPFIFFPSEDAGEHEVQIITDRLLQDDGPLSEIKDLIREAECIDDDKELLFQKLRDHSLDVLLCIANIPIGITNETLKDSLIDSPENEMLSALRSVDLPCDSFYQQMVHKGSEEACMFKELMKILQNPDYVNWTENDSKALVLVREKKAVVSLFEKLQNELFIKSRNLNITYLVGHGKSREVSGLSVKKQKRVLDNQHEYHIIVATSIAEEGIDLKAVGLVVSLNPPTTLTTFVQIRGRARKKQAHFFIFCTKESDLKKLDELRKQESEMMAAVKCCVEN